MQEITSQSLSATDQESMEGQGCLGSTLLFLGAGLIFISIVERTSDPPLDMPRFWVQNRSICILVSLVVFVCGCVLLKRKEQLSVDWSPSHGGRRFDTLVLYTRDGCHLCDHAKDTLLMYKQYLPVLEEVSIDSDPELTERFSGCIPVVEIDQKVRFRGKVDEILLRRLIEGSEVE